MCLGKNRSGWLYLLLSKTFCIGSKGGILQMYGKKQKAKSGLPLSVAFYLPSVNAADSGIGQQRDYPVCLRLI